MSNEYGISGRNAPVRSWSSAIRPAPITSSSSIPYTSSRTPAISVPYDRCLGLTSWPRCLPMSLPLLRLMNSLSLALNSRPRQQRALSLHLALRNSP